MAVQSFASLTKRAGGQPAPAAGPSYDALGRIKGMSAQQYWNLPNVDGEDYDFSGIWNPSLDKSQESVLTERATERRRLSDELDQQTIRSLPPDQAVQASYFDQFNKRGRGNFSDVQWAPFFESISEAGEGGKQTKIGFESGPHDFSKQLGPNFRSIANDPKSTFNTQTGPFGPFGSGPATDGPYGPFKDDPLGALQRKGYYVDENGHAQIKKKV